MLTDFLNRLGLLRPATAAGGDRHPAPHEFGAAPEQVAGKPGLVSPITPGLLEALGVRHALAVQYAPPLAIVAHRYHIDTTPRRVAAWLATLAHESARFTRLVENLNYSAEGLALGLDILERPELLEQPYYAALSAAEWWHRNGCNALADTGDLAVVTRKVNGGLTGLDDRLKLYAAAMTYIGSA